MADDVIDLRSDAATTGKTPGTDLREGVPTMPVLLLRARVAAGGSDDERQLLADIDGDLSDDAVLADVVARLAAHSVVDETSAKAREWAVRAEESVAGLPDGVVKDAFRAFSDALVARASLRHRPPSRPASPKTPAPRPASVWPTDVTRVARVTHALVTRAPLITSVTGGGQTDAGGGARRARQALRPPPAPPRAAGVRARRPTR
ncbi:hypothetical protein GCM10025876_23140 [Demequina litorisediminis]|uniref:DUF222 domain-containing protein n=1 Tax=Demequina litorisediminis TaxID=1849022 RepID=A0ABQ6IEB5_9MICO|nr:hypothetical protein GCM10025876_23140 [Demequina litorisediminis]